MAKEKGNFPEKEASRVRVDSRVREVSKVKEEKGAEGRISDRVSRNMLELWRGGTQV